MVDVMASRGFSEVPSSSQFLLYRVGTIRKQRTEGVCSHFLEKVESLTAPSNAQRPILDIGSF